MSPITPPRFLPKANQCPFLEKEEIRVQGGWDRTQGWREKAMQRESSRNPFNVPLKFAAENKDAQAKSEIPWGQVRILGSYKLNYPQSSPRETEHSNSTHPE